MEMVWSMNLKEGKELYLIGVKETGTGTLI